MKAWVEHYVRLLNVELEWPSNKLPEVQPNAGLPPTVSMTLICKALRKMKCSKAAAPSGIIAEMMKSAGEEEVELARQLTGGGGYFIPNPYQGEALDCGNYRGLNLKGQVMKLLEWVLDCYICEMVNIDDMQLGLCLVEVLRTPPLLSPAVREVNHCLQIALFCHRRP